MSIAATLCKLWLGIALASIFVTLNIVHSNQSVKHQKSPPEFTDHEIVNVFLFGTNNQPISFEELQHLSCSDIKYIEFSSNSLTIKTKVHHNDKLIPGHYFEQTQKDGLPHVRRKREIKSTRHCHYGGSLVNQLHSFLAFSIYKKTITGIISTDSEVLHIYYDQSSSNHLLLRSSQLKTNTTLRCGVESPTSFSSPMQIHSRKKRSSTLPHAHRINERTRYVELILVNDYTEYANHSSKRKDLVFSKSQQIANIVNSLYNQVNIFVALVGVIIWSEKDEIVISDDGDTMLNNFLHYRQTKLLPNHPNDNAQLITGRSFKAGVVGKALKGPICTYEFSGGVNADHSDVISLVATTVAHELGHNFGLEHDTPSCSCGAGEKCIMSDSSGTISPRKWSNCSIEQLDHALAHGMDYCLHNEPRSIFGPVCGNGFTEKGEECDCGLKDFCDNPCCNPSTCKLAPKAQCAVGSCCNLTTCSFYKEEAHFTCRKARSECDLTEVCDGKSEYCPEDVYVQDGTSCGNGEAYCYHGQCSSHESQCQRLWGSTGHSLIECYRLNIRGIRGANCGLNRITKTYKKCAESDVLCGLLQCDHLNEKLEFGMESAAEMSKFPIISDGVKKTCRSGLIDLGLDVMDPGLVPNGAICGENKMCLNQKCVSVDKVKEQSSCPSDCFGNGFCDNLGNCHCMEGFALPDCEQPVSSFYYLTLALYIIFLCILPLTAFAGFIIYYFHSNIKTWWTLRAKKANIKARARQKTCKSQHLTSHVNLKSWQISKPLPLNGDNGQAAQWPTSSLTSPPESTLESSQLFSNHNSHRAPPQIVPTRPAPPPPVPPHATTSTIRKSNISRSSSTRSSVRPKHPPPLPPDRADTSSSEGRSDDSMDPLTSTSKNRPSNPPPPPTSSKNESDLTTESANRLLVKALAEKFESDKK